MVCVCVTQTETIADVKPSLKKGNIKKEKKKKHTMKQN